VARRANWWCGIALVVIGLVGCVKQPAVLISTPSHVVIKQVCPDLEFEVIADFDEYRRGRGILGFPYTSPPNATSIVNEQVERHGGDGAVDVKIVSGYRYWTAVIIAFVSDAYPQYYITGKVVKYTNRSCRGEGGA